MWFAVCELCRERRSLFLVFDKGALCSLLKKAFPRKQAKVDISVFRWLCQHRPRLAQDQPMIEQPKLVFVWMTGGATDPTKFLLSAIDQTCKMTLASWPNKECSHDCSRECGRFDGQSSDQKWERRLVCLQYALHLGTCRGGPLFAFFIPS